MTTGPELAIRRLVAADAPGCDEIVRSLPYHFGDPGRRGRRLPEARPGNRLRRTREQREPAVGCAAGGLEVAADGEAGGEGFGGEDAAGAAGAGVPGEGDAGGKGRRDRA